VHVVAEFCGKGGSFVRSAIRVDRVKFDVLVLGGGGMGAAALAHLAAQGVRAIGIEQDEVPSGIGSSVGQTRIIRKAYFEDERYVPLLTRSDALWRELEAETRETLYVRTGCSNLGLADHPDVDVRNRSPARDARKDGARRQSFRSFSPGCASLSGCFAPGWPSASVSRSRSCVLPRELESFVSPCGLSLAAMECE
jgi:hypothetical protein